MLSKSGFTHRTGLQSTLKAKDHQHKVSAARLKIPITTKPKNTPEHCLGTSTLLLFMNTHTRNHREPQTNGEDNNPSQSAFFCNPSLNEVQECVEHSKSKVFEVPGFLHFETSHDPPPKPYLSPTTALESLLVHQLSRDFKAGREGADRQQDKISHTSSRQSSDPNPSGKSGGGTFAPGFILLKSK